MIKAMGSGLVLAATIWMGMHRAENIRDEYRQMRYLWKLVCVLEGEIAYSHIHLADIFSNLAQRAKEPYRSWLTSLCRELESQEAPRFGTIWEESVKGFLGQTNLPSRELERFSELGNQLGIYDRDLQLTILKEYKRQLQANTYEMQGEMKNRIRLCHCLGVMSGVMISVLLL